MRWRSAANRVLRGALGLEIRRVRADEATPPAAPSPPDPLPPATLPAGAARAGDFFDRHPRFAGTSRTSATPDRLALRHQAIFGQHAAAIAGATVLDIASHDGRWSLAALEAGATHVTGIEARPDLVAAAAATFVDAGRDPATFRFVTGDVFDVLARDAPRVDVVLCLGFAYHTWRYTELLTRVVAGRPRHVIVDTEVDVAPRPVVHVRAEPIAREGNAVADPYGAGDRVLVGRPTLVALDLMLTTYGYRRAARSDWAAIGRDNPERTVPRDYATGRRVTVRYEPA